MNSGTWFFVMLYNFETGFYLSIDGVLAVSASDAMFKAKARNRAEQCERFCVLHVINNGESREAQRLGGLRSSFINADRLFPITEDMPTEEFVRWMNLPAREPTRKV